MTFFFLQKLMDSIAMRLLKVLISILMAMMMQSCKIEMPSLVEIIASYKVGLDIYDNFKSTESAYSFRNSEALKAKTGFKDTLIIGDNQDNVHGMSMEAIMKSADIPEKNMVFFKEFGKTRPSSSNLGLAMLTSDEWTALRRKTKVVHVPYTLPLYANNDASKIAANEMLFIVAAGNWLGDLDIYNINHVIWHSDDPGLDRLYKRNYRNILNVYSTGKAIAATSALVTETGKIEPRRGVVRCGDIKEACFVTLPGQTTSSASARLAAMSFYLSQFWETPEEVVEVLKECAIDIGEPGVDRMYGNGAVNLLCPRVLKKEIEVVSEYLGDTGKRGERAEGGEIEGRWKANNTMLQVRIPPALKKTLQAKCSGKTTGTIKFKEGNVTANFTTEAVVRVVFLVTEPIEAKAKDTVRTEGTAAAVSNVLSIQSETESLRYTYTATEDSLHLVKSLTLNEVLALLPNPLGSMVDMASPDFFKDDPIQIRMSFAKEKPILLGDFNEDGTVDAADFLLFVEAFGSSRGDIHFEERMDIVPDGIINIADLLLFFENFGKTSDS